MDSMGVMSVSDCLTVHQYACLTPLVSMLCHYTHAPVIFASTYLAALLLIVKRKLYAIQPDSPSHVQD